MLLVAAWTALLLFPGLALAHAEIKSTSPKDKSTVTQPVTEISATYTDDLRSHSRLKVTDAAGTTVATGAVDPDNDRRIVAQPSRPLAAGTFTVASTAIAIDGHIERQRWSFTVNVPPSPTPSPTPVATDSSSAPSTAAPTATSIPTTAPITSPAATGDGGTPTASVSDVLLPIVATLAIVTMGAGWLLGRRRGGTGG